MHWILLLIGTMALNACDKGRAPDSTANQRLEKIRCERGFKPQEALTERKEKLASDSTARVRTVIVANTDAKLSEQIQKGEKSIISESNVAYLVNAKTESVAEINCATLTANLDIPELGVKGQAKIVNTDIRSIEFGIDGAIIKIEKEMPAKGDDLIIAKKMDSVGLNKIKFSKTSPSTTTKILSETGNLRSSDLIQLEESMTAFIKSRAELNASELTGEQSAVLQKLSAPAFDGQVTAGDLEQINLIMLEGVD